MKALLGLKFFLTGMLVFIVASTVSGLHGCKDLELKYLIMAAAPKDWRHPTVLKETPALILDFAVFDVDLKTSPVGGSTLLERFADLAEDLKKAGAKVVLIPLKEQIFRSPENMRTLERMKKTGIVIIGYTQDDFKNEAKPLETGRSSWWSEYPLVGYKPQDSLGGLWAPLTLYGPESPDYQAFIPYGLRHFWEGQPLNDATILAVHRYLGTSEQLVQPNADELHVGSHKIPLWGDGIGFAKGWMAFPDKRYLFVRSDLNTTALTYGGTRGKKGLEIFNGKIVVVPWFNPTHWESRETGYKAWYVINSILNDNLLVRTDSWEILLIILYVCASALLLFFFPTGRIVFCMALSGVALLLYCRWLIDSQNIILDPLYPLLALLMSTMIFPVVKVVHERNSLREELSSLAAEKKRLEDEQASEKPKMK